MKGSTDMRNILQGPSYARGLPVLPREGQAVGYLTTMLDKALDYRRTASRPLPGNHVLIRFLGALLPEMTLSDEDYLWAVEDSLMGVTSITGFTGTWTTGTTHQGVLYGDCDEAVLVTVEPFNPEEAKDVWQDLQSIRVLAHPYADFSLPWLDGSGEGARGAGRATLEIRANVLAYQYKRFYEEEVHGNPDSPPGMNLFFMRYPLANALACHLDLVLANRLMALALGQSILPQRDPNPFYLNFSPTMVDATLEQAIRFMVKRSMSFDEWLSAIPQLSVSDYHQYLGFSERLYTRQSEWLTLYAQLNTFSFLLAWNAKMDSHHNRLYLTQLNHWLRRITQGRLLDVALRGRVLASTLAALRSQWLPYLNQAGYPPF